MFNVDPLIRRQIGAVMLVMGFVFLAIAGLFSGGHYFRRSAALADAQGRAESCQVNLRITKAEVVADGERRIFITWKTLDDGMATLGIASAAATMCPGWQMSEFCMGSACKVPGASMTLMRVGDVE